MTLPIYNYLHEVDPFPSKNALKAKKTFQRDPHINGWKNINNQEFFYKPTQKLGIQEAQPQQNDIKISPNPVSSHFKIISKKPVKIVKIYNTAGLLVRLFHIAQKDYDLSDLPKGIYIVHIETNIGNKSIKILKK